jgi:hypothetical protein
MLTVAVLRSAAAVVVMSLEVCMLGQRCQLYSSVTSIKIGFNERFLSDFGMHTMGSVEVCTVLYGHNREEWIDDSFKSQ